MMISTYNQHEHHVHEASEGNLCLKGEWLPEITTTPQTNNDPMPPYRFNVTVHVGSMGVGDFIAADVGGALGLIAAGTTGCPELDQLAAETRAALARRFGKPTAGRTA